ncbi:4796f6fa-06cc-4609-bc25-0f124976c8ca [Thermothielavioides terrestris]|uniref:Uncharacterized protein n=2 Tax=Thermothielavioides terrestris TaxID=2587410 RepID=G2QV12_THETT|nr:uncharacterized protein THITE_2110903 [Thermothielavioides terrestris NRRL 8126]AEO64610.1 hypothetical protein THITE_2110903 [Thermothielavioides terrestris NRRL 8126]SPQ26540.1 4796f6fa-06cc-4609-bc25-0f124976c8ca [Thermothielavioides terrestris]
MASQPSPPHPDACGVQPPQPVRQHHLQTTQPPAAQPMNPQQPHAESTPSQLGLRGGRSEMCPGRFCFCVP